ncbi:DUF4189 domain-containing protein [Sinorhizobium fredii]|uniref:DUF4189 domain-containing protein n=1 Tax=Rhizobium fredii TaxID=380 RepID=UPI0009B5DAA4|nr:DUF4189 domain-containing protein [Sinorhizobium fredii]
MRFLPSFLTFFFLALSTSAQANSSYGSIAVVPGQGLYFHGIAIERSASEARQAALELCGKKRCKVVQNYGPGQCMHVVTGNRQIFWNDSVFSQREKTHVLRECQKIEGGCKVIKSICMADKR